MPAAEALCLLPRLLILRPHRSQLGCLQIDYVRPVAGWTEASFAGDDAIENNRRRRKIGHREAHVRQDAFARTGPTKTRGTLYPSQKSGCHMLFMSSVH